MSQSATPSVGQDKANSNPAAPLITVSDLSIGFEGTEDHQCVVKNVSFTLQPGRVLALIGESGSGKTLVARSLMGLLPRGAHLRSGAIEFDGRDLAVASHEQLRSVRGKKIGMILQEPMVSLNPSMTIGRQLVEGLMIHEALDEETSRTRAVEMLEKVGVPDPLRRLNQYPHEFSGGMRQRIMIASVMLLRPDVVIADEPTTALDAIIQRDIMALILRLTEEIGASVLLITHDLGVVANYADDVVVMRRGEVVERGPAARTLSRPAHAYTKELLEALPNGQRQTDKMPLAGVRLVRFENVGISFPTSKTWPWSASDAFRAVHDVSFDIQRGEIVAIVGESGSGKTTLGRALLGLVQPSAGQVYFNDNEVKYDRQRTRNHLRDHVQLIFQDPYSSLNPRLKIASIVAEAIRHKVADPQSRYERAIEVLAECGLGKPFADRFPHQLSGGQRQRVCIARALVNNPELVVADEPVAALDLTVQAKILSLMKTLQRERGFSLMFISHDLAVVEQIADRIVVMKKGWIVEHGSSASLFAAPAHPYTQKLLEASPFLEVDDVSGEYQLKHRKARAGRAPAGHVFFDAEQTQQTPLMHPLSKDHFVAVQKTL